MYTLYIANKNYSSWSLRPWVLMRSLSIPFEERLMTFEEGSNWKRFRAFSPNGRVPCLHDGNHVVWDSLAIIEYLAERHKGVWPDESEVRAWARCVACEMHSGFAELRRLCPLNCGLRVELNGIGQALRADLARMDEIWSEGLTSFGGPFLAGEKFSAVDAFFAPVVFRHQTFGLFSGGPSGNYADFMLRQPAMQAWYADALNEPWRDSSHEAELATIGTVRADHRAPIPAAS